MRVGFAGTPAFAARALEAIARAGYTIPLVLTQPDRPKGRGLKLEPSPVKALAASLGIPVLQPATLKSEAARAESLAVPLDVLVVAAYGLILPEAVLAWPRHGCLNIHASKLPRWRGAAPIVRAIEAGDATTGITIMKMDAGLDTGPMVEVVDVPIGARETGGTLHDRLALAGAQAIVTVLRRLERDEELAALPQPAEGATYATKVGKSDAAIDWRRPAASLDALIRAYDPSPGAHATCAGEAVKVWRAHPVPRSAPAEPGEVVARSATSLDVACGTRVDDGALRLVEVQPAGGRRMTAGAYAAGRGIDAGSRFGPGVREAGGATRP
ncbi:MAG: methionyl-tRNA formyltransferase [Betaproteobacteria bacterium]|nr:methionyl-tRNA formyltransferase [Betaproteobacteria bacterium]